MDLVKEHLSIIVDTREKKPYDFPGSRVQHSVLKVGDYSLRGYTKLIAVERKSLADFHSCCMAGGARLAQQLAKLSQIPFALLVAECSVSTRSYYSTLDAYGRSSVVARLLAEHRVPIFFADNRSVARHVVQRFLAAAKRAIDSRE